MLISFSKTGEIPRCDVCVVGAGPVGIALALECERRGLSVLVLESGQEQPDRFAAALTAGHAVDEQRHAATAIAMHRGLGGTSRWWGGRCVPFDEIDFAPRPHVRVPAWPITYADMLPWYDLAADFFGIASARFVSPAGPWTDFGDARGDRLERWTPEINAGVRHRTRLVSSANVTVLLGATVNELHLSQDGRRIDALTLADSGHRMQITPARVVLACGALETTRLMLHAQQRQPHLFAGGALGLGYMGHLSGKIADLVLADPAAVAVHDFFLDQDVYVRRRLTLKKEAQLREKLLNVAFWADNPSLYAAGHGNGVLSMAWLALATPWIGRRLVSEGIRVNHIGPRPHQWLRHLKNVGSAPFSTALGVTDILRAKLFSRKPGFLTRSQDGRYALHYLAEQTANDESRVRLSSRTDALGVPFLDIDLRYSEEDASSVLRSHQLLDQSLRQAGLGRLEFRDAPDALPAYILRQAADGYHQIGTTRMGLAAKDSVVNADCRVHGVENLYVSSSSVFPSSGQANPTFVAVALALRLAAHLTAQADGSQVNGSMRGAAA